MWSAQRVPTAVNLCFLDLKPLLFCSSSSSIDLTRLSGPRSRPTKASSEYSHDYILVLLILMCILYVGLKMAV
jgi:hypothetical protein